MTVTPIDKVLADGNCGEATNRGEEARVQNCGATNRNRIQGRSAQVSVPCNTKPFRPGRKVNAEPVQGKFTFLSGEICPTYLGVGLARKPGPCMRKRLGVGQKSAEGIVLGRTRHCG